MDKRTCIILTGSRARETAGTKSDTDLLALSSTAVVAFSSRNGSEAECIDNETIPLQRTLDYLAEDLLSPDAGLANRFHQGRAVQEDIPGMLDSYRLWLSSQPAKDIVNLGDDAVFLLAAAARHAADDLNNHADEDDSVLAAHALVTAVRYLAILAGVPSRGTKQAARAVRNDPNTLALKETFTKCAVKSDWKEFAKTVSDLINKTIPKGYYLATGSIFPADSPWGFHILIPYGCLSSYLASPLSNEFETILASYPHHAYLSFPGEVSPAGLHIHAETSSEEGKQLEKSLLSSFKSNSILCIKKGITPSFPFRSVFPTGYAFGGKQILSRLLPFFRRIYGLLKSKTKDTPTTNAAILLIALHRAIMTSFGKDAWLRLRRNLLDLYCALAADPSALLSDEARSTASKALEKHILNQGGLVIDRDYTLDSVFHALMKAVSAIDDKDIELPETNPCGGRRHLLLRNVANHTLAITNTSPRERWCVLLALFPPTDPGAETKNICHGVS